MLTIEGLGARYGDVVAIQRFDLTLEGGEIVCLLGPSGCGKSTLLRVIAGLERPAAGRVLWDGTDLAGVAVHRRGFGLMFQDYALFPHRTVAENVAFGLRMQKMPRHQQLGRVDEVLTMVGLAGYGPRGVGQMSGGQQQRVALARAIAPSPRLLMFDEPLGSLDRTLRERLVLELHDVLTRLRTTALYVTHDQEEAFALADRVVLMRDGLIEQVGTPSELWSRPRTPFAARFLGFRNLFSRADALAAGWPVHPEHSANVVYRADGFVPDAGGPFAGSVASRTYRGDHFLVRVDVGAGRTLEMVVRWQPVPPVGEHLRVTIEPGAIIPVGHE